MSRRAITAAIYFIATAVLFWFTFPAARAERYPEVIFYPLYAWLISGCLAHLLALGKSIRARLEGTDDKKKEENYE